MSRDDGRHAARGARRLAASARKQTQPSPAMSRTRPIVFVVEDDLRYAEMVARADGRWCELRWLRVAEADDAIVAAIGGGAVVMILYGLCTPSAAVLAAVRRCPAPERCGLVVGMTVEWMARFLRGFADAAGNLN